MRARSLLVLALLALLALAAAAPAGARAAVIITSGPEGVTEHDLAAFAFVVTPDEQPDADDEDEDDPGKGNGKDKKVRFECRLDAGDWSKCESPVVYAGLAEGRHRFEVRRRKKQRTAAERSWTVQKPKPPKPPDPPKNPDTPRPPDPPGRPNPPGPVDPPGPPPGTPPGPPAGGSGTPIVVPGDLTPPTVTISPDARISGTNAEFRFAADEPVAGYECSLGDAPFAPCTSPLTARVEESGSYVLRVRATDLAGNRGAAAVAAWTVVRASSSAGAVSRIESAPPPAGAAGSQSGPVLLTPFPLVRLVGLVYRRSVKVSLLSVRAPVGARISISCRGRTCPLRRSAQLVAAKGRRTVQTVTFGRLRNKRLGAGTVLEVRVTKAGRIGKYVRFAFRSGKAPKRSDRCLAPGRSTPSSCPSS